MSEFLDQLESKIDAIDERERKKIIKEYQVKIEEKMEEGKSEEEAIHEFGNIDEIAKAICESYHVNLVNKKKTFKEKMNEGINMSAKFLAEAAQDTAQYAKENTKDKFWIAFFEILLKIVILVILIMILKVPFLLLQTGIDFVLNLLFYPFNMTLSEIFEYIISVLYMAVCIASSIYMFKGYFEKDILPDLKEEKEELKKEMPKKKINYAVAIIKILLMIIVVIPMIFLNIAFLALTILAIFLVFKGVEIVGLAIILLSFFLLTLTMTTYVTEAIDNKDRNHLFALCISVISLIIGIVLFVDDLIRYNYPDTLDESHFKTLTETVNIELDKETSFIFAKGEVEYITDESIADNNVLIEVTYYDDFIDITIGRAFGEDHNQITFVPQDDNFDVGDYVYLYENIIKDLKDNNIFRYGDTDKYKVKIYCNEKTRELIK